MDYALSSKKIIFIVLAIGCILIGGRLIKSNFDCSYFIVAGTDFVDPAQTPAPVIVQKGQGYDGQFFYKYALNPFSFNNGYGINVDHPAYRMQRIAYPALAWLASLGGRPLLVPPALILVNLLAFAGIFFFTQKLVALFNGPPAQALYPLLLCGLYMSIARDLSEVVELFFFTGAIYYLFKTRYLPSCIFVSLTLLTRDTSMIAWLPLLGCMALRGIKKELNLSGIIYFIIPFLLFAVWKGIIYLNIPSIADAAAGYVSFGLPFKGIAMGFYENLNLTDNTHIFQLLFWTGYILWQVCFAVMILRKVAFSQLLKLDNIAILKIIYLSWLVFAICFSDNIYGDDWGFVRVFSMWNMAGFLLLVAEHKKTSKAFLIYSAMLAGLTIARLVIRV